MEWFENRILTIVVVNWLTIIYQLILFSEPHASPRNLRLNDTTSISILVEWDDVPPADQNGIILSYTVRYQAIGGVSLDAPVYNKTVDSSLRRANLTDLIKNHNYNISVMASTVEGNGPYSDPIYVMTNQDSKWPAPLTRY